MKILPSLKHPHNNGFSLIEVMVATALLVMVVSMIGFVFRQSSMSWDSGIRRAEGSTLVRAVIGAIERDLRAAVDSNEFGLNQSFTRSSLSFIALLEPENGSDERVPTRIQYSSGTTVERTARRLTCSGGTWSEGTAEKATLLEPIGQDTKVVIKYETNKDYSSKDGLPAFVSILAELNTTESFSGLSVRSCGRDGIQGTKDDIVIQ